MNKKLKIFTTSWHTMHFWDLFNALKEDADFFICHNTNKRWYDETRPLPENATMVAYYEPGKYDFAILDVDQQLANPDIGKRKIFVEFNELIQDIPKVVINHGCPVYPEFLKIGEMNEQNAEDECRKRIKSLIDKVPMVVNSHEAASDNEWGWGYPIIHGMNPDDWFDLPKEPRVFTALSPGGCDEYYNRMCMDEVGRLFNEKYSYLLAWAKRNVKTDKSFDDYREFLGRSLIYLDTSFRTPMNRARTEAMFSGCCVVQVEGAHDLDKFAVDGENIILVPNNPETIVNKLVDLIENHYDECVQIGQNAKKMAMEKFSYKRYRQDWLNFITKILKIKK